LVADQRRQLATLDWLAFISTLVDSLAWPAVIIAVVLAFKQPLSRLIPNLRELQYKDLRVDFGKRLEQIEAEADRAQLPEQAEVAETTQATDAYPRTFQDYVARIAETSPRAAIAEAWRFVETALLQVAEEQDLPQPYSAAAIEHFLRRHGRIPPATANLLRELRQLRNGAVHAGDFGLTSEQAREYGGLAVRLISAIHEASREPSG
jgi:hypothetical protein